MSNISYPKFGKVKTIVLPAPQGTMTIDEYKDAFGIDLREILEYVDDHIFLKPALASYFAYDVDNAIYAGASAPWGEHALYPVTASNAVAYGEGTDDAFLSIGAYDPINSGIIGIAFKIDKDTVSPSIEDLVILNIYA